MSASTAAPRPTLPETDRRPLSWRAELGRQLRRRRTLWSFALIVALPVVLVIAFAIGGGGPSGNTVAGLAKVGTELYEAARLDGAGFWSELRAVSLPAVRGELAVAITLTMVAALRTFELVYVMTAGGPGNASRVPSYEVYDRAIQEADVGTGITVALVLTVVILGATWLVNRVAGDGQTT